MVGEFKPTPYPSDIETVHRWNDLRAAYLEKGLRVLALLAKQPAAMPEAVEFSLAVGRGPAYGEGPVSRAVLIGPAGKVGWTGEPKDLPLELLAKLVRKSKAFRLRKLDPTLDPAAAAFRKGQLAKAREQSKASSHPDAAHLTERIDALVAYWQRQSERATRAGNPAEAALFLKRLARHVADTEEAAAATEKLKALKSDYPLAKETSAHSTYARLHGDRVKAKGKRKRLDALVKKARRFVERYPGTRGAARAERMIQAIEADPAISAMRAFIAKRKINTRGSGWRTRLPKPPQVQFAKGRRNHWVLETNQGTIKLKLYPDIAPMHVSSVIYLTELGYFDGLVFHRVIPGFMAQGGCPNGSGSGDPGYLISGEFDDDTKHDRAGLLSAANRGPDTDGSQFFITFGPASHLDGKHTVYGEVVEGMDALKKIEKLGSAGGGTSARIVIEKATITAE